MRNLLTVLLVFAWALLSTALGFLLPIESASEDDTREWYYCRSKFLIERGVREGKEAQRPLDAKFERAEQIRRRIEDEERKFLRGEPNRYEELVEEYRVAVAKIGDAERSWTQESLRETAVSSSLEKFEDPKWRGAEAILIDPTDPPEGMQCTPKTARDEFRVWLDASMAKLDRGDLSFDRFWESFQQKTRELEGLTVGQ